MPNIGAVLKDEIARISRKEIRKATDPLRKTAAAHRHEIAALKRELAAATRMIRSLSRNLSIGAAADDATGPDEPTPRITSKGISSLRKRLGLSAEKFGLLAGVSGQTVYHWEDGAKPRRAQLATLVDLKGLSKQAAHDRLGQIAKKATRRRK
jgi:DNA-binding transcriptional regulator YiaG